MSKPFNNFEFATDANYATGPDIGTPTKVAPSAGEIDSGFVRGTAAVAQHMNYLFGEIQDWLYYLAGLADDAEFLASDFHFTGDITMDGTLTVNEDVSIVGATSDLTVGRNINSGGLGHFNGVFSDAGIAATTSLTTGTTAAVGTDLTVGGTIRSAAPVTVHKRKTASAFLLPAYFAQDETNVYGYFRDAGGKMTMYSGGVPLLAFVCDLDLPIGAKLTEVVVSVRTCASPGGDPLRVDVDRLQGTTGNANSVQNVNATAATTGSDEAITLNGFTSSSVVFNQTWVVRISPSANSSAADPETVYWVDWTYTTSHVDPNT